MADEQKGISQAEVDALDKEVNAKLAEEAKKGNEDLAKKIRADVEREFKQKKEMDAYDANWAAEAKAAADYKADHPSEPPPNICCRPH